MIGFSVAKDADQWMMEMDESVAILAQAILAQGLEAQDETHVVQVFQTPRTRPTFSLL